MRRRPLSRSERFLERLTEPERRGEHRESAEDSARALFAATVPARVLLMTITAFSSGRYLRRLVLAVRMAELSVSETAELPGRSGVSCGESLSRGRILDSSVPFPQSSATTGANR